MYLKLSLQVLLHPTLDFNRERTSREEESLQEIVCLVKVWQGHQGKLVTSSSNGSQKTLKMMLLRIWYKVMALASEIFDVYPIQRHVSSLSNCQYKHHNSRDFLMKNCGQRVWLWGYTRHQDLVNINSSYCSLHYYDTCPEQSVKEIVNYLCTFKIFFSPCTSCIVHVHVLYQLVNKEWYYYYY